MTVCILDWTADGPSPEMANGKLRKVMAANEIAMVGYQLRLLSRVEVAQDTIAFHFVFSSLLERERYPFAGTYDPKVSIDTIVE